MRIIIVGGGPAGASCALWLNNMGYQPYLIEAENDLGGLLRNNLYLNNSVLGIPNIKNESFSDKINYHINISKVNLVKNTRAVSIKYFSGNNNFLIDTERNFTHGIDKLYFDYVIIATGTRVAGHGWIRTKIINKSQIDEIERRTYVGPFSTYKAIEKKIGERWLVLGGGANAVDLACRLADQDIKVTICVRSIWRDCPKNLLDKLSELTNKNKVSVIYHCEIKNFFMLKKTKNIFALTNHGTIIQATNIGIMFGFIPNSDLISITPNVSLIDANGYYIVDKNFRTKLPNLYAIGDVSNNHSPCISTAIGSGTVVAKNICLIDNKMGDK